MNDSKSSFTLSSDQIADDTASAARALECVEAFTDRFNARDLAGMDALLHFPHIILSGETLTVWDGPGQLPDTFFDNLTATTGWHRSKYREKRIVLVGPRKVHLLVEYSRDDAAGRPITLHRNLWVVTFDAGRWGIKQRSY